jgi:hypothetical protein
VGNAVFSKQRIGFIDHVAVAAEVAVPRRVHRLLGQPGGDPAGIGIRIPVSPADAGDEPLGGEAVPVIQLGSIPDPVEQEIVEAGVVPREAVKRRDTGARGDKEELDGGPRAFDKGEGAMGSVHLQRVPRAAAAKSRGYCSLGDLLDQDLEEGIPR